MFDEHSEYLERRDQEELGEMHETFDIQEQVEIETQKYNEALSKLRQALNVLETAEAIVLELKAKHAAQTAILRETAKKAVLQDGETIIPEDVIAKVNGKMFRCDCGCNVFRHPEFKPYIYVCNACEARYYGEA